MEKIKYTYEDFKKLLSEKELILLQGEFKNSRSEFILIDKNGYKIKTTPYAVKNTKKLGYFHPNNEFALDNISLYLKINNTNLRLISTEYIKATDKLEFECPTHGIFQKTFESIKKGNLCPECSICKRYKEEDIKKRLAETDFEWISGEYKNCNSKIIVKHKEGYLSEIRLVSLMTECNNPLIFHNKHKYTIHNIKLWLSKNSPNVKLISKEYINSTSELELYCEIHSYYFKKSWTSLLTANGGCPKCNGSYVYSLEEVKAMLSSINPDIKIIRECKVERKGYRPSRGFECECVIDGHTWISTFTDLITKKCGCNVCAYRNMQGKNNWNYNHDKSEEERMIKREYREYYEWRKSVYERDNYTCVCCGYDKGGKLNAHHLYSYDSHKKLRTEVCNGVTLCKDCHENFHREYGYGDNTKEQFEEWINNKKQESA